MRIFARLEDRDQIASCYVFIPWCHSFIQVFGDCDILQLFDSIASYSIPAQKLPVFRPIFLLLIPLLDRLPQLWLFKQRVFEGDILGKLLFEYPFNVSFGVFFGVLYGLITFEDFVDWNVCLRIVLRWHIFSGRISGVFRICPIHYMGISWLSPDDDLSRLVDSEILEASCIDHWLLFGGWVEYDICLD